MFYNLPHIKAGVGNDLFQLSMWLTPSKGIIKTCLHFLSRICKPNICFDFLLSVGYMLTTFCRIFSLYYTSYSGTTLIYGDKICVTLFVLLMSAQFAVCSCELDCVTLKMSDDALYPNVLS